MTGWRQQRKVDDQTHRCTPANPGTGAGRAHGQWTSRGRSQALWSRDFHLARLLALALSPWGTQAGWANGNLAQGTCPAGTEETWGVEVQASSMTGLS